ncbi:hypothetical protein IAR50_005509 [Cryptococcus sp. DSM 104548]
MVKNRGMIFVTFFDSRAAERARDGMHGLKINRRPIDVHYSLPRPDEMAAACSADKNQGSVLIVAHPPRPLDISQVRRMAEAYGDVKEVERGHKPSEVVVEYYDSRGALLLQQQMDRQTFMGVELELRFIWDKVGSNVPPPPVTERISRAPQGYDRHERGPRRDSYPDPRSRNYARERSPDYQDRRASYPSGTRGPGGLPSLPPAAEDPLEKARKVQALLQNLSNNVSSAASSTVNPTSRYQPASSAPARPPSRPTGGAPYPPTPSPYTPATSFPPYPSPSSASTPGTFLYPSQAPKAPPPGYYAPPPSAPNAVAPSISYAPPSSSRVPPLSSNMPPTPGNAPPTAPKGVPDVSSLLAMLNQGQ